MYCLLHIKATLFINFCATVIVTTWVTLIKCCRKGLNNMYLKPFFGDIFLKIEAHWLALASQSEALKLIPLSLQYGNISRKARHVHLNTAMANFSFLPEAVLLFISLPLKSLASKHLNQIYVNKKNSCMV